MKIIQALSAQVEEIVRSKAWKLMMFLRKVRTWLLPANSPQENFSRFLYRSFTKVTSALRRSVLFIRKVLDFYAKNGFSSTLLKMQKQLKQKTREHDSYQALLDKFPQKFRAPRSLSSKSETRDSMIDSAAQIALQKLMSQLNTSADAKNMLSVFKDTFEKNKYYHILEDLFTLEQFMTISSNATIYPLLQTSELPEISKDLKKRNILFITSQFPNPHHGGGNRVLNFIKILSEQNNIYLCTSFYSAEDEKILETITPYCCSILKIKYWQFGNNQTEIRKWLNGIAIDVVHYEWPHSLKNYDASLGKYHIFTYMEAVSLRLLMDMELLEPVSMPWVEKLVEIISSLRLELVDAARMSARIAVTTKDGAFFKAIYPYQEYAILNHGVTFDEFNMPDSKPEAHTLVFVGNYLHYPNTDAISYFFNEIWEGICKEIPDVRIYLVGTSPPAHISHLADGKKIIVTGSVPDVRPYIQKASICIAPLITGAGMRGKVIEYAGLCRTFVATSIATTDLVFEDGVDYLLADTASEFTQKVVTLLKDPEMSSRMAATAYQTARQNYDTRHLTDFLNRLYSHLEKTSVI